MSVVYMRQELLAVPIEAVEERHVMPGKGGSHQQGLFFEKIAKPYSTLSPAEPSPMAWAILEKVLPS